MRTIAPLPRLLPSLAAAVLLGCQSPPAPSTAFVTSTSTPAPRSIEVTGTAEIKTVPDEITLTVGADAIAAEADAAREASSKAMHALLEVARAEKIDPKDLCNEGMTLQVQYDSYERRHISGYEAHNSLSLTLHDREQTERVITELSKAGANRIDGVVYGATRIVELRKQARLMAIEAARDKAQAMAAALGQKVQRPLRVSEAPPVYGGLPVYSNAAASNDAHASVGETMATGKLHVQASVSVTFELSD